MYAKLALSNAKKSIKDYLIYFITITICVSLFYAISSLSSSSYEFITEKSYNFRALKLILQYATYLITAILILLIAYVNKYMIKRREREFATYILLGAEQKNVALMFFIETLVIGVLAIVAGIFVGTLFSQVITAIVLVSAKQKVAFNFKLYLDTVVITFIFFSVMFCIIGLGNIRVLRKTKLIDMLNAQKQVEFQFRRSGKVYSIIFSLSVIFYVICGFCTYKLLNTKNDYSIDYSMKSLSYIGISFITFIIATYALFYSISYIIIQIKNKCINFKYEGTNLFLIGSIVSKIKTAPILMATISITFLGAMISFIITLVMAQWAMGYLEMRVPYDVEIRNQYSDSFLEKAEQADIPKLDYSEMVKYLDKKGYGTKDYCQVEKYIVGTEGVYNMNKNTSSSIAIKLSDFNKLRSMLGYEAINLKDNEFTTQWYNVSTDEEIENYLKEHSTINIDGENIKISKNSYYKDSIGEGFYSRTDNIIILPDKLCDTLSYVETNFVANLNNEMSYEEYNDFQYSYVDEWFSKNNYEFIKKYSPEEDITRFVIQTRIKVAEANNILNITLAMRILGIYLGVVLLMISLTILSLSQLVDSIEHKDRFNVIRKLGVEERGINKLILKQISIYFIVPMFIALIGTVIFIYNYYLFYRDVITVFVGDTAYVLSITAGLVLMLAIYSCYYAGTYYTFKRNINTN